jgi:hypothetical protein
VRAVLQHLRARVAHRDRVAPAIRSPCGPGFLTLRDPDAGRVRAIRSRRPTAYRPRGRAGRPLPRVENRGCGTGARRDFSLADHRTLMPGPHPKTLRPQLALWVAAGGKIRTWCEKNKIPRGTAYEWSKKDTFKQLVEDYRDRAVDRAIGKMAKNLGKAVETIVDLLKADRADHIKLSAAKTLIDELLRVQSHTQFKAELQQLNERLAVQEARRAQGPHEPRGGNRRA